MTGRNLPQRFPYNSPGMLSNICPWRGILIPVALIALGIACLITQTAWIPGRSYHRGMALYGTPGIVMGLMFIAWALGLHIRHSRAFSRSVGAWADAVGALAYVTAVALGLVLLWMYVLAALV